MGALKGATHTFMAAREYEVEEVGLHPLCPANELKAGEVGYVIANVKAIWEARAGVLHNRRYLSGR